VVPSEWLLAFSMFIFACLALVKRYVELALRIDRELPDPSNRNYRLIDLPIIGALAAASGFNAITIFALYASSPAVKGLYRHPELLWLVCPILMYWLSRMVILAHRRVVDDDPIVFALRDRNSRVCAACMVAIVLLAT
jgi:4-hydroxybenzoate polyprenyltransferase